MREIKFRALPLDPSVSGFDWVYGYYAIKGKDTDLEQHVICQSELNNGTTNYFYLTDIEVIKDTVSQYTGLKDKNGVEIYEGDILHAYNSSLEIEECRPVTFENGTFTIGRYWKDGTHDWFSMEQYGSFELEVIGNIHQNPELIK